MPLQIAAQALNLDANELIFIGDTSFDLECADAFGCQSLGVNWGIHSEEELTPYSPEIIAKSFLEIETFLKGCLS